MKQLSGIWTQKALRSVPSPVGQGVHKALDHPSFPQPQSEVHRLSCLLIAHHWHIWGHAEQNWHRTNFSRDGIRILKSEKGGRGEGRNLAGWGLLLLPRYPGLWQVRDSPLTPASVDPEHSFASHYPTRNITGIPENSVGFKPSILPALQGGEQDAV